MRVLVVTLEFGNVCLCGGRKTREPGKKASEQGEKQQTQPTYGWRRALSPLRQCTLLHLNKENKEHTTAITTLTSSDIPMMPC